MEPKTPEVGGDPAPVTRTLPESPRRSRPAVFAFLAPPQSADEIGRLGGFRVLRLLGEGGMGMVFLAEDPALGRRVALKVMKPEAARHDLGRLRFLREARAAAAVEHDHVVPVLQVGEDGGVPFLAMPVLKGESLEARLKGQPRLPAAEAARIGRETAEGLAAAHAAGLVHRDIKPSNLWLEPLPEGAAYGGRVKVLDFGLARAVDGDEKLTRTDAMLGTAGYMAPEQARAEPVDARADLFSLGCVLYRMLTGKPPFRGATLTAVLTQLATHDPPPPHIAEPAVPAALSDLVMRLLAKDPAGRPASAREAANALREMERAILTAPTESLPGAPRPLPAPPACSEDATPAPAAAADTAPLTRTPSETPSPPHRGRTPVIVASLALTGCVLLLALLLLPPVRAWLFPPHPSGENLPPPAWKGFIDVVIFDPDNPRRQNVHLNDPDVLPLKPGDKFAVEAQLDRPAYCYILWIDADGTVDPVYPWKPPDWGLRPADERPVQHLRRPEAVDHWFKIKESAPGMITLVLLVRDTPLPPGVDLKAELGEVRPQDLQTLRSTAWFENGEVVRDEPGRKADFDEEKIDDPVRATQEQLRSRLGGLFAYTRAVSFADRGK